MKLNHLFEASSEYQALEKHKQALTDVERSECIKKKACYTCSATKKTIVPIWKSVDPKTNKVTYVTATHRAYGTAKSLSAIINKWHNKIEPTG